MFSIRVIKGIANIYLVLPTDTRCPPATRMASLIDPASPA
jgi:hypothetical protein